MSELDDIWVRLNALQARADRTESQQINLRYLLVGTRGDVAEVSLKLDDVLDGVRMLAGVVKLNSEMLAEQGRDMRRILDHLGLEGQS